MTKHPSISQAKEVSLNGQVMVTNWRGSKIASPDGAQKVKTGEGAKQELLKQKQVRPESKNSL